MPPASAWLGWRRRPAHCPLRRAPRHAGCSTRGRHGWTVRAGGCWRSACLWLPPRHGTTQVGVGSQPQVAPSGAAQPAPSPVASTGCLHPSVPTAVLAAALLGHSAPRSASFGARSCWGFAADDTTLPRAEPPCLPMPPRRAPPLLQSCWPPWPPRRSCAWCWHCTAGAALPRTRSSARCCARWGFCPSPCRRAAWVSCGGSGGRAGACDCTLAAAPCVL